MLQVCEINLINCTINHFNKWAIDMQTNGWEFVINDGKFYMQRRIVL